MARRPRTEPFAPGGATADDWINAAAGDLAAEVITNPSGAQSRAFVDAATARAGQAGAAITAVLPKLIPLALRLVSVVRVVIWASVVAAIVILVAVLSLDVPRTVAPWVAMLVIGAILLIPAIVLSVFRGALIEVLQLPEWLRSSPDLVRQHGTELSGLVREANGETSNGGPARAAGFSVFRAGRLLLQAHKDLPQYGGLLKLMSLPFLFLVMVCFAAAWFELLFACFAVVLALLARLF